MKITFCLLIAACLAFVGCNEQKAPEGGTGTAPTTEKKADTKAPAAPATNAPAAK